MADERDFELLDDYLTNRMGEQDRTAFEQRLKADPDLQHEYAMQKRLIQGIKETRIAELKSMLNKVPVPAANAGNTLASKIILGTVASLIIVAAVYWFLKEDQTQLPEQEIQSGQQIPADKPSLPEGPEANAEEQQDQVPAQQQSAETDKNQTSAGTEHSKPSLARRPAPLSAPAAKGDAPKSEREGPVIDVFTPDDEDTSSRSNGLERERDPALTPANSSIVVETDRNNRRYTFHYQFRDGKLFLFGPIEKDLYEIMEFFSDEKRTVFLYYKDQYYLLQEADDQIRPLAPIRDAALIRKLKEYRSSK